MLTLGIDTCCMASTAAVTDGDKLIAQTVINQNKTHSQMMLPQIEAMLNLAGIDPCDIELFAAAVGPGSFTGVRIGVATIKGMAQATQKPCVAVSTLKALAYSSAFFDGIAAPILDARRGQVYNALFDCKGGKIMRLTEDRALPLDELLAELKQLGKPTIFMGDATFVFKQEIQDVLGDKALFAPVTTSMNLGGAVAALGEEEFKNGKAVSYSELVPAYVRLSQAERDLLEKNK